MTADKGPPIRAMLRQYRLLANISQNSLALDIGISAPALCRFEAGKSLDEQGTVRLIAWLFGHGGDPE